MEYLHQLTGPEAYLLLCGLVFIEEAGVPIPFVPGDVVLLAGGYLASIHVVHLWILFPLATLALVGGACVCYAGSRRVGRPVLDRWGRYIGVTPARLERAAGWLERHGAPAIIVARLLPGTRINASFAAGCLRLSAPKFVAGVLVSSPLFALMFLLPGLLLGTRVEPLLPWYDRAVVVLLGGALLGGLVLAVRHRRRGRAAALRIDGA